MSCCGSSSAPSPTSQPTGCCGDAQTAPDPFQPVRYFVLLSLSLTLWIVAYVLIEPLSLWIVTDVLRLNTAEPLGAALQFFLYDTPKILLLLAIMLYGLGWIRAGMDGERLRRALAGKGRFFSYLAAAGFGAVTPFCSCSGVPLFISFIRAGIPIGTTMAFLITSPLINEVAVILLWGLLGWKFTLIYVTVGLVVGILGGAIMDLLRAERWLQPLMQQPNTSCCDNDSSTTPASPSPATTLAQRHAFAKAETFGIFRGVWLWVVIGVGLGAILHGYVPQEWFTETLGRGEWWSVPIAVAAGIPLYVNCSGIIPIMESLLLKGLPVGTTLAFCMSALAASLPELLMLKQVMKPKLLLAFILTLLVIFTLVGWLFNATADFVL